MGPVLFSEARLHLTQKIVGRLRRFRQLSTAAQLRQIPFHSGLGDLAQLLHGLTRSAKPEICVEIGSARGKSTCYIGLALKENGHGKLYAIDPHEKTNWNDDLSVDTFELISHNLRAVGVTEQVEIIRKTSDQVAENWTKTIDILFIDGDHSYDGVKRDWDLFAPHVREFGVVIFHDTLWDLRPDPNGRDATWVYRGL